MSAVTGIADRATEGLHYSASSNGGPPPRQSGPSPLVVLGAAFLLGVLVARLIDWRTHAHPRD